MTSNVEEKRALGVDDFALIERCLSGDDLAWTELVDKYQRLVYSIAIRSGLSSDDADDVFQVVFTTLFRRMAGLRDQTRLAAWLITTAQRESWRVSKLRRAGAELNDNFEDNASQPPDIAEQADRDQRVRDAMSSLDLRCRELLTALFLESDESSYGDISKRLGMPVGSIGPTRTRCFRKLETLLIEAGLSS